MNGGRAPVALIIILVLSYAIGHIPGLIVAAVILFAGYMASVRLNPRIKHRACGGTGRRAGWIYTWTHHRCSGCGGNGRVIRYGTGKFGTSYYRERASTQASARKAAKAAGTWR